MFILIEVPSIPLSPINTRSVPGSWAGSRAGSPGTGRTRRPPSSGSPRWSQTGRRLNWKRSTGTQRGIGLTLVLQLLSEVDGRNTLLEYTHIDAVYLQHSQFTLFSLDYKIQLLKNYSGYE